MTESALPATSGNAGYYGLPMLRAPVWGWHVAWYFLLEGISAGACILSTVAQLAGDERDAAIVRTGRFVAAAALLPCPALLVADLGRPERFHHMLREFKPSSPMNTGAWALTAYSAPVGMLALKEWTGGRRASALVSRTARLVPATPLAVAALPCALTMISYPGVLLSTTSTPMWARTRLLGALVACSSMSTGAAAISFVVAARTPAADRTLGRLQRIEHVATGAEALALAGYLLSAGKTAEPLTCGRYCRLFWGGAVAVGLVAATVGRVLSKRNGRHSRPATMWSAACTIAGAWALKWALVHGGRSSAEDPTAAQYATQPQLSTPGWRPPA
ncbi:MAG: hypothetical protein V7647_1340 [Acidobacteriota bacterium]